MAPRQGERRLPTPEDFHGQTHTPMAGGAGRHRRRHPAGGGRTRRRPRRPTTTRCWSSPRPPVSAGPRSTRASTPSAASARPTTSPIDVTQNSTAFTPENLANYQAVVFLNTTGDVLTTPQETAFQQYVTTGGGYVGVHAAAETEPEWTFYRGLVGTGVSGVASTGAAPIEVADRAHPATKPLARQLTLTEEWYNYATNVRGTSHVLATVKPAGSTMGYDHPVSWCKDYQGGRSFYTGLGHSEGSYANGSFRKHLLGGIQWAAGAVRRGLRCHGHHQLREGRAQRRARRADDPGGAARRPGAAQHPQRPDPAVRPGHLGQPGDQHDRGLPARRGRPAVRHDRPGLRHQQVGLPVLRAAAEHADHGRAGHQHRPDGLGPVQGLQPAVPGEVRRGAHAAPGHGDRAEDPAGQRGPGHLLPRGRRGQVRRQGPALPGHRRRHQRRRLGRVHPDQRVTHPGTGLRRAALGGQHQRSAGQGAQDQGQGRRYVQRPGRQPLPRVAGRRRQDPSGDLPDGAAQPVPLRRRRPRLGVRR